MNYPNYEGFFSENAIKLVKWSLEENNRIKSSKIRLLANKIEHLFRKKEWIINNNYVRGNVRTLPTGEWMIKLKHYRSTDWK